jgi:hypothetical protein
MLRLAHALETHDQQQQQQEKYDEQQRRLQQQRYELEFEHLTLQSQGEHDHRLKREQIYSRSMNADQTNKSSDYRKSTVNERDPFLMLQQSIQYQKDQQILSDAQKFSLYTIVVRVIVDFLVLF